MILKLSKIAKIFSLVVVMVSIVAFVFVSAHSVEILEENIIERPTYIERYFGVSEPLDIVENFEMETVHCECGGNVATYKIAHGVWMHISTEKCKQHISCGYETHRRYVIYERYCNGSCNYYKSAGVAKYKYVHNK